jgi:hypothetical protein
MKCKTQKLIARGRDLSEPLAKISVPQERGGLAKLHCSQRDHETLHLAGLRRRLARNFFRVVLLFKDSIGGTEETKMATF